MMNRTRVPHGDFVIEPRPNQLRRDDSWTTDFYIERRDGSVVNHYYGQLSHPTRDVAILNSLAMAARIIDGRVPGCSLP